MRWLHLAAILAVASWGSGQGKVLRVKLEKANAEDVFHAITLTRWPADLPAIATAKGSFGTGQRPFSLEMLPASNTEPGTNQIQHWEPEPKDATFDKASNSLILRGPDAERLAKAARDRDARPGALLVYVEFVALPHGYMKESGYRYIVQRSSLVRKGPALVGIGSGNVTARLRNSNGLRVIGAPVLRSKEGLPATASTSFTTFALGEPIRLPVGLVVVPRVYADGTISLGIGVQGIAVGASLAADRLPKVTSRQINLQMRVKADETVVLGEFVSLPRDSAAAQAEDLVVFVTPHLAAEGGP